VCPGFLTDRLDGRSCRAVPSGAWRTRCTPWPPHSRPNRPRPWATTPKAITWPAMHTPNRPRPVASHAELRASVLDAVDHRVIAHLPVDCRDGSLRRLVALG
jgi:hypothetical protein